MSSDTDRDVAASRTRRSAAADRAAQAQLTTVPTPRPGSPLDALDTPERGGRRGVRGAIAAVAVVALAGTGIALADGAHHRRVEAAAQAQADRVSASHAAAGANVRLVALDQAALAVHEHAVEGAQAAVTHADGTLATSPHADAAMRDALTATEQRVAGLLQQPDPLVAAVTAGTTDLQAADQRVIDSEASWQAQQAAAAAAAQAAAEQAAAAQAAAAQAAAAKAATAAKAAPKPAAKPATQSSTTQQAPAGGSSGSTGTLPAGALQCTSAGSGASEASASALGAAINAYRSAHGLSTLAVSASGSLTSHALDMANAGGIWHSGHDNIVGCVSNGSYDYLVQAWDGSAPHRAQMQRTDVSTMYVGAATRSGWLYGAVFFG
jgi:uncharacterized protein YkwD